MDYFFEFYREAITNIEIQHCRTCCEPHWHEAIEILCTLDDDVSTLINSNEKILHPGEICVADCYDVHSFNSNGKDVYILIIPREYLGDFLKIKGKKHLSTPYVCDKNAWRTVKNIIKTLIEEKPCGLTEKGYINVILGVICEQCGFSDFSNTDVGLMKKILNFIEENYTEEVSLEYLAKKIGYSKYYFSRIFNKFFRFNLNEYLSRVRIRHFLLKIQNNKNADIISTAFDCGFNSWQTFYRCFKLYYGTSPKKYLMSL